MRNVNGSWNRRGALWKHRSFTSNGRLAGNEFRAIVADPINPNADGAAGTGGLKSKFRSLDRATQPRGESLMIIRIPRFWAKPNVPGLFLIPPTREQPVTVDELTVLPENFVVSGIPYSYDSVREICWRRTYTQVTGMSFGSKEEILFSFKTNGGAAFSKSYRPMFLTEARRKMPNAFWSAFCFLAEQSYSARIASYTDQVQQFNRWTIGGTTFDPSGYVIKDGKTIQIQNAKISRSHDHVSFVEGAPHKGIFKKTKTIASMLKSRIGFQVCRVSKQISFDSPIWTNGIVPSRTRSEIVRRVNLSFRHSSCWVKNSPD